MIPQDLLFTDQHEWIRVQGDTATVGISDYAQNALGDITFVELPKVGKVLKKGDEAAAIESCKAAASVYAPVSGKVTEVNAALAAGPELINKDPYAGGWLCKIAIADKAEIQTLMSPQKYAEFSAKEA